MKRTNRILPVLALAIAAAVSMPAMARDHGRRDHDDRDDRRSEYRNDHRNDHRYDRRDDRDDDRRHDDRYYGDDRRYDRRDRVVYVAPRDAPPAYRNGPPHHAYPRWSRGARYDTRGYAPTYVVRDYGHYGLRAPPRGHHWRRDDRGDFILVAVATGLIASVIFR